MFPLLLFLTTLLGYLAGISARLGHVLFLYVSRVSPSDDVTALLTNTLNQVTLSSGGARLSLSLLAALWVASSGMLAMGRTLNKAHGVDETRPWWQRRLVAVALTVGISVLIAGALVVMFYGRHIGEALADELGVASVFVAAWPVVRWPLVLAFMLLAFETIYNFAPSRAPGARRLWGTPGAVVGVGLWVAVTIGLQLYNVAPGWIAPGWVVITAPVARPGSSSRSSRQPPAEAGAGAGSGSPQQ